MDASANIPDLDDENNDDQKLISQFISIGNLSEVGLGDSSKHNGGNRPSLASQPGFGASRQSKSHISGKSAIQDTSSLFTVSQNDGSGLNI